MPITPHKEKLLAAIQNPKSKDDVDLLKEALVGYNNWIERLINSPQLDKPE